MEPRGTDERAGAAAIEARDGRETGPCGGDAPRDETTSVGRRARVLHAARSDESGRAEDDTRDAMMTGKVKQTSNGLGERSCKNVVFGSR